MFLTTQKSAARNIMHSTVTITSSANLGPRLYSKNANTLKSMWKMQAVGCDDRENCKNFGRGEDGSYEDDGDAADVEDGSSPALLAIMSESTLFVCGGTFCWTDPSTVVLNSRSPPPPPPPLSLIILTLRTKKRWARYCGLRSSGSMFAGPGFGFGGGGREVPDKRRRSPGRLRRSSPLVQNHVGIRRASWSWPCLNLNSGMDGRRTPSPQRGGATYRFNRHHYHRIMLWRRFFGTAILLARDVSSFGIGLAKSPSLCTTQIMRHPSQSTRRGSSLFLSGGFGGGGAASSKSKNKKKGRKGGSSSPATKKMSPRDAKRAQQQLVERYGGDIGRGTQERIQAAIDALEPHLREAAELHKSVTQFDALVAPMTAADRNRLIPAVQAQMAEEDRKKLKALMEEHGLSDIDLHNIYQRATWDAAADAKATQADIVGNTMKADLQERITKACRIAVGATESDDSAGKVLDVGCGHGAIVRSLADAGLEPDRYVGIDLSEEMVDAAVERYGKARSGKTGKGRVFVAGDFFAHDFGDDGVFDSVIFCSALHDLPDMESAIAKGATLLRSNGGKLIVVHAQGASHVLGQVRANPVMVSRGLPTTKEWVDMLDAHTEWGLTLEVEPADARSDREEKEGYLAVLSKV